MIHAVLVIRAFNIECRFCVSYRYFKLKARKLSKLFLQKICRVFSAVRSSSRYNLVFVYVLTVYLQISKRIFAFFKISLFIHNEPSFLKQRHKARDRCFYSLGASAVDYNVFSAEIYMIAVIGEKFVKDKITLCFSQNYFLTRRLIVTHKKIVAHIYIYSVFFGKSISYKRNRAAILVSSDERGYNSIFSERFA